MDHRALLRSLAPDERRHLNERSDRRGLAALARHWGAIVLVGGLIVARVPGWQALIVVQGVLVVFLFTLLHETSHATAFRTGWLNTAVGRLCGVLVLVPAGWFRHFHLAHHRHTQDPQNDPELAAPKPETWSEYLLHLSGLPVWRSQLAVLARNAAGRCTDGFVPAARRGAIRREAQATLAGYGAIAAACVATGFRDPLYLWLLPLLAGQPFLRLYLLAEHGRCPMVANMFENSRTTFTTRLVRALAWNMPYHAEHHAMPTVPFHRLPDLHRLSRAHLRTTERGYTRFHRKYAAALRR